MHRRLLRDDRKGVGEALNETEFDQGIVARGQHYLILGPSSGLPSEGKMFLKTVCVLVCLTILLTPLRRCILYYRS